MQMRSLINPYAAKHPGALAEGARYNGYRIEVWERILERAVWSGDTELLWEVASCNCCCEEHTFGHCPAKAWGGCRGQYSDCEPWATAEAWAEHYERFHGMTREQFFR